MVGSLYQTVTWREIRHVGWASQALEWKHKTKKSQGWLVEVLLSWKLLHFLHSDRIEYKMTVCSMHKRHTSRYLLNIDKLARRQGTPATDKIESGKRRTMLLDRSETNSCVFLETFNTTCSHADLNESETNPIFVRFLADEKLSWISSSLFRHQHFSNICYIVLPFVCTRWFGGEFRKMVLIHSSVWKHETCYMYHTFIAPKLLDWLMRNCRIKRARQKLNV